MSEETTTDATQENTEIAEEVTEQTTEETTTEKVVEKVESEEVKETQEEGETIPESYDLKLAKDTPLDQTDVERIAANAKELGLTNEEAQTQLELESEAISGYKSKQEIMVKEIREGWIEAAKKDKDIGGDNFKGNLEKANRVIEKYGSEAFRKALNETGFGDHPEVIRIFSKLGGLMANDEVVLSKGKAVSNQSIESKFYGETKE